MIVVLLLDETMDKSTIEWLVSKLDVAIRGFTLCAAISGFLYLMYNRQLQKLTKQEIEAEKRRTSAVQTEMQSGIAKANETGGKMTPTPERT